MATDTQQSDPQLSTAELLRFFSVLSHDLKSPLFSIDGFSELLLADYGEKLDEEGVDFLRRVRSSAHQMKRTLEDMSHMLKLLSRPDAVSTVDVSEVLDEIRLKYNYLLEESGTSLIVPERLPVVSADREKLREAIGALLSNAINFNDRPKGERVVEVSSQETPELVRISVRDNGIGIDPRYAEQVFELGLKLDKSRGGGPGYGLFLARRVAEGLGGRVVADTKLDHGSTFTMEFPR